MNSEELKLIKRINWDYNINPEDIYRVIKGEKTQAGHWDFNHIFIRCLERLSWYELLEIVGLKTIKQYLTKSIIEKIRFPEMRSKYERLRKILHNETVSYAKWGPEYREQIRNTLFSKRWYSA
ncbi:MAG: hypothetical protein ACE5D7_01745 [Fidelibacterota bacterium]